MISTLALLFTLAAPPDLLNIAVPIAATKGWSNEYSPDPAYAWISPKSLIYWTHNRFKVDARSDGYRMFDTYYWHLYDVRAHRSKPLPQLTSEGFDAYRADVSPDGKSVLWSSSRDRQAFWFMAKIDGSQFHYWPRHDVPSAISNNEPCSYACWTLDSKTIVESENSWDKAPSMRIWMRSVANPEHETEMPRMSLDPSVSHVKPIAGGRMLGMIDQLIGFYDADYYIWDPHRSTAIESKHKPEASDYTDCWFCAVSPDGKRMLWKLHRDPNPKAGIAEETALAVTRTDGSGLAFIGTSKSGMGWRARVDNEAWVPGGKFVSFTFAEKLYQVPIPVQHEGDYR